MGTWKVLKNTFGVEEKTFLSFLQLVCLFEFSSSCSGAWRCRPWTTEGPGWRTCCWQSRVGAHGLFWASLSVQAAFSNTSLQKPTAHLPAASRTAHVSVKTHKHSTKRMCYLRWSSDSLIASFCNRSNGDSWKGRTQLPFKQDQVWRALNGKSAAFGWRWILPVLVLWSHVWSDSYMKKTPTHKRRHESGSSLTSQTVVKQAQPLLPPGWLQLRWWSRSSTNQKVDGLIPVCSSLVAKKKSDW